MNYKTTLIIAAIAATAFAALGSALPVFETAYASNDVSNEQPSNGGGFNVEQGDACNAFGDIENCAGNIAQSESNFQQGVEIESGNNGGGGGGGGQNN